MRQKRQKRRRRGQLEPLSTVLREPPVDDSIRAATPVPPLAWHEIVGPRIAERARPMRLAHGVLQVRVANAVWAQELSFLAPSIVERLAARGYEVSELRFRVGPIEPPLRRPVAVPPKQLPPVAKLPPELTHELETLDDPRLREAIARAASANLAWQVAAERAPRVNEAQRASRGLRFAEEGSAPPDRTTATPPSGSRRRP